VVPVPVDAEVLTEVVPVVLVDPEADEVVDPLEVASPPAPLDDADAPAPEPPKTESASPVPHAAASVTSAVAKSFEPVRERAHLMVRGVMGTSREVRRRGDHT
jgi:hypothetical protein